jgi:hypothetical protein
MRWLWETTSVTKIEITQLKQVCAANIAITGLCFNNANHGVGGFTIVARVLADAGDAARLAIMYCNSLG